MDGEEPVESGVGKRESRRKKKVDASHDASKKRADARDGASYSLRCCAARRLLAAAAAPAAVALNARHVGFLPPAAGASISHVFTRYSLCPEM